MLGFDGHLPGNVSQFSSDLLATLGQPLCLFGQPDAFDLQRIVILLQSCHIRAQLAQNGLLAGNPCNLFFNRGAQRCDRCSAIGNVKIQGFNFALPRQHAMQF